MPSSAPTTSGAPTWENIKFNNILQYSHLNPDNINKEKTLSVRRGFHSMALVLNNFMDREKDYLAFLAKRASVPPRCFFTTAHRVEVDADLVQLHKLWCRMIACRDKVYVVGEDSNTHEIQVVDLYMPVNEETIDASELGMALFGVV